MTVSAISAFQHTVFLLPPLATPCNGVRKDKCVTVTHHNVFHHDGADGPHHDGHDNRCLFFSSCAQQNSTDVPTNRYQRPCSYSRFVFFLFFVTTTTTTKKRTTPPRWVSERQHTQQTTRKQQRQRQREPPTWTEGPTSCQMDRHKQTDPRLSFQH